MTPEILNHLDDLSKVRMMIALGQGCREIGTEMHLVVEKLEWCESLLAKAIMRESGWPEDAGLEAAAVLCDRLAERHRRAGFSHFYRECAEEIRAAKVAA